MSTTSKSIGSFSIIYNNTIQYDILLDKLYVSIINKNEIQLNYIIYEICNYYRNNKINQDNLDNLDNVDNNNITISNKFDIEFIIMQLCHLLTLISNYKISNLFYLILSICSENIHISLKAIWLCNANSRNNIIYDEIAHSIEMAATNRQILLYHNKLYNNTMKFYIETSPLPTSFSFYNFPVICDNNNDIIDPILSDISLKQKTNSYFNSISEMIPVLELISSRLLTLPTYLRDYFLQDCLRLANTFFIDQYFPISTSYDLKYKIKCICDFEGKCMNSRNRVPFLITFEVIYENIPCLVCNDLPTPSDTSFNTFIENVEIKLAVFKNFRRSKEWFENNVLKFSKVNEMEELHGTSEVKSDVLSYNNKSSMKVDFSSKLQSRILASPPITSPVSSARNSTRSTPALSPVSFANDSSFTWGHLEQPFGESWNDKKARISSTSRYFNNSPANWDLISFIFKAGDDLRQEVLAMQLINIIEQIWKDAGLNLQLTPYKILITSADSGLIETIPNALSIHSLKLKNSMSFHDFFVTYFTQTGDIEVAKRNYFESLAAYSIVTYILQIKDRHNGNILLNDQGKIIHIDFGYMLSTSPGNNLNFETHFKITQEYLQILNIDKQYNIEEFKKLFISGFMALRRQQHKLIIPITIMSSGEFSSLLPCFKGDGNATKTVENLKARFFPGSDSDCLYNVKYLFDSCIGSWRSNQYDNFQRLQNGIV